MKKNKGNSAKRITKRHIELVKFIYESFKKPIRVNGFIFPNGQKGILSGYIRLAPDFEDLKVWEVMVGVYTDAGDFYTFAFDDRKSMMKKKPTFSIDDQNYYFKILRCYTIDRRVDPKTGITFKA